MARAAIPATKSAAAAPSIAPFRPPVTSCSAPSASPPPGSTVSIAGTPKGNAACEGFFGRLKTELFYPRDWKATTVEQFVNEVDSYIRWYNEKRIKVSLGSLSPVEYRQSLGIAA